MVAPITVRPIIPLGPDTIIEGNPYQIAGRPTPQPVSATVAPVGNMGLGGYTPQQSANVTNLLRAALPAPQPASAPASPAPPASLLMGLFRDRNPLAQGLLAAGKALTDYGAPSTMPKGGFMGALGAGGQGFVTGYQAGEDANLANRLAAYKLASESQIVGSKETGFFSYNPLTGETKPIVEGSGEAMTSLQRNLIAAGVKEGSPEWNESIKNYLNKQTTTLNIPAGYRQGKDGGLEVIPDGPADKYSDAQALSAGFADRMMASTSILDTPEIIGAGLNMAEEFLSKVPGGNLVLSPEFQQYDQARRDFVNAVLRRESGAAIAVSEFENANKQYLPVPGDSPQVLEQKRANRINALNSMKRAAGPKYVRELISRGEDNAARATGGYPEGTVIANAKGEKLIKRSGKWIKYNG